MSEPYGLDRLIVSALASGLIGFVAGWVGNIVNQRRLRTHERAVFGRAIHSEVSYLVVGLKAYRPLLDPFSSGERNDFKKVPQWPGHKDETAIYNGNTSKIGLFDHSTAQNLFLFYNSVRFATRLAEELDYAISKGRGNRGQSRIVQDHMIRFRKSTSLTLILAVHSAQ